MIPSTIADQLSWYDYNLEPGNYSYTVTAKYDLSEYGFPGQFDESFPAGPILVIINFGKPLPFYEPWDAGTFSFNTWTSESLPGKLDRSDF